jgi:hypothetical protein
MIGIWSADALIVQDESVASLVLGQSAERRAHRLEFFLFGENGRLGGSRWLTADPRDVAWMVIASMASRDCTTQV